MQVNKPFRLHILGTDTDVGKTWVSSLCLEILSSLGRNPLPIKPVHSGWPKAELCGPDLQALLPYSKPCDPRLLCAYAFEAPMSPFGAAQLEGRSIELSVLEDFWKQLVHLPADTFVVEGIGGVCCPLNRDFTYLEWLQKAKAPVVLISKVGLGSLNQAIMSYRLLKHAGLEVCAIVLNEEKEFAHDDLIANSCREELGKMVAAPIVGPLKRGQRLRHLEILKPMLQKALTCN